MPHAPGLKSLDDALDIRRRVLVAFEEAEREPSVERRRSWLTFVVVGGGPTGVEMTGALAEIARHTLARDFRSIEPSSARVILVEAGPPPLPPFPPRPVAQAGRPPGAPAGPGWAGNPGTGAATAGRRPRPTRRAARA